MERDRGGGMLRVCEVQMESWFLNPVSKRCLQRIFKNSSRKREVNQVLQHPLFSPAAQGCLFSVSSQTRCQHQPYQNASEQKSGGSPCKQRHNRLFCSKHDNLLLGSMVSDTTAPIRVYFAVKRQLCVMQKKIPFPSVYLSNKD